MTGSTTQWIWHTALAMDPWRPPEPKNKRRARFGPDAVCWLCGGAVAGDGWPLRDGIKPTFTDFNRAAAPGSQTVCGACVALSSSDGYAAYARRHGRAEYFPVKPGKRARALNWLYFSHVINVETHITPDRKQWRASLLDPPMPPFVMAMAVNGKKQVLFRCPVNASRDAYVVQADETAIVVEREGLARCLADFEALYNAGFSKTAIASGQYNTRAVLDCGLARFRALEAPMAAWRAGYPGWVQICAFCAQKIEGP